MKKKLTVSLTEMEADVLWSCLSGEILQIIKEDKPWAEKYPIYDFYKDLREKIDYERKMVYKK